jgi:Domain of unknown function (DUF6894)
MAQFWCDVCRDDGEWSDDEQGTDIASAEEAGREAMSLAYALALGQPPARCISIRVRNHQPEPLLTVRVSADVLKRV